MLHALHACTDTFPLSCPVACRCSDSTSTHCDCVGVSPSPICLPRCHAHCGLTNHVRVTGHPSGAAAVSKAWQDLAHSHLAASLAAAVPVPPMLAPAPAAGVNPPRHTLADLYTQTDRPVFDPAFQGRAIKELHLTVWTPDCACGKLVSVLLDLPGVCHVFTPQDCEHGSNKSTPCRIAHCSSCGSAAEHSSSATAEGAAVEASSRTQPGGCVGTHSPGVPWRCSARGALPGLCAAGTACR